ncbi:MAG: STAS domain-containing protein [Gammaproteobacteria bacterium]
MIQNSVAISEKSIGGEIPMIATEITDSCLYTGLFGSLDSRRMSAITEEIMAKCEVSQLDIVILDLGNVNAIDSHVSNELVRLADTMVLIGIIPVFCGIKRSLASSMVHQGVNLGRYVVYRDLKSVLKISLKSSSSEFFSSSSSNKVEIISSNDDDDDDDDDV